MANEPDYPAPLPAELADALEAVRLPGRPEPRYYPLVTSTNDLALRLAAHGAPDGTIVIADQQTAGRGRAGHVWFSPPGAGAYVTMLLRPGADRAADWPRWLTLAAGVALAEGILSVTGLPVRIKWPNDLVVVPEMGGRRAAARAPLRGSRKLGGVLAEAQTSGARLDAVVVGYGVNVGLATYPAEISARTTSLEAELGRPVDRALVVAGTLGSLAQWVHRLRITGGEDVLRRWRELGVGVTGARVTWRDRGAARGGITAGLDGDGALLVRQDGATARVLGGEVTWL